MPLLLRSLINNLLPISFGAFVILLTACDRASNSETTTTTAALTPPPPRVISTNPQTINQISKDIIVATGVKLDTVIRVQFNDDIEIPSAEEFLVYEEESEIALIASIPISYDDKIFELSFTPTAAGTNNDNTELQTQKSYRVLLSNIKPKSATGTVLENYSFSFTTYTAPIVKSRLPKITDLTVPVEPIVVIEYNLPMAESAYAKSNYSVINTSVANSSPVLFATFTPNRKNNSVSFRPVSDLGTSQLATNTQYKVIIQGGASGVSDKSLVPLTISSADTKLLTKNADGNFEFDFTTSGLQITLPEVLNFTPRDQASSVNSQTSITFRFNKSMNQASLINNFELLAMPDNTPIPTKMTYNRLNNIVSFKPDSALIVGTLYKASLAAATKDEALLANMIGSSTVFNFTVKNPEWTAAMPIGSAVPFNNDVLNDYQQHDIVQSRNRQFSAVIWTDNGTAMDGVKSALFDNANIAFNSILRLDTAIDAKCINPKLVIDDSGKMFAAWQQVSATGTSLWANNFDGSAWGTAKEIDPDITVVSLKSGSVASSQFDLSVTQLGEVFLVWNNKVSDPDSVNFNVTSIFSITYNPSLPESYSVPMIISDPAINAFTPSIAIESINGSPQTRGVALWGQNIRCFEESMTPYCYLGIKSRIYNNNLWLDVDTNVNSNVLPLIQLYVPLNNITTAIDSTSLIIDDFGVYASATTFNKLSLKRTAGGLKHYSFSNSSWQAGLFKFNNSNILDLRPPIALASNGTNSLSASYHSGLKNGTGKARTIGVVGYIDATGARVSSGDEFNELGNNSNYLDISKARSSDTAITQNGDVIFVYSQFDSNATSINLVARYYYRVNNAANENRGLSQTTSVIAVGDELFAPKVVFNVANIPIIVWQQTAPEGRQLFYATQQ